MDFGFIDSYQEPQQDLPPTASVAQDEEITDLVNVAKYVPCIHWEYDPSKGGPESNGDQLGFVTQALLKVPGLASAVTLDENGVQTFDSRFVAAAALSLVAALARKVLNIDLSENYANDIRNGNELGAVSKQENDTTATNPATATSI